MSILGRGHTVVPLVASDRDGDWESHIQAVQDLLPTFRECNSLTRYGSFYLEKIRMLRFEYPSVYEQFMLEKFVVQTEPGGFKGISPDMKLEQTIQKSKKSPGSIVGQTKKKAYLTEWELIYHEALAISNCFTELTQPEISSN